MTSLQATLCSGLLQLALLAQQVLCWTSQAHNCLTSTCTQVLPGLAATVGTSRSRHSGRQALPLAQALPERAGVVFAARAIARAAVVLQPCPARETYVFPSQSGASRAPHSC